MKDPCNDCDKDPISGLKQIFVDLVQASEMRRGQPAMRPVFLKQHGGAYGWFEPIRNLPREYRQGVFGMGRLAAWVRFSSDKGAPTGSDLNKCPSGIGIKLFGVPGPKLMGDGATQDFVLLDHDVYFADNASEFCKYTKATIRDGKKELFFDSRPESWAIFQAMLKTQSSLLAATYGSCVPYAFGPKEFVKYKLEPELKDATPPPDDPNYLAADLARRLREGEARFRFCVQFRTDPKKMPLDHAMVRWDEAVSPPVVLGTLVLPRQDIAAQGQSAYADNLSFNPWHCLKEHEPQGSLSEARRVVYAASAEVRRAANGVPTREPAEPRGPVALPPVKDDFCIVRAAIYPPIGVARVGNSKEYFVGPEVTEPLPPDPGFYRDRGGKLKRQAAKFRIFGMNTEGQAVAELTASNAKIKWSVHVANQKAAWYQFQTPLDIPEAAASAPALRRNASVQDRSKLILDPGPRSITGRNKKGLRSHKCVSKPFMGMKDPVYLGELRTDEEGRLEFLGGFGISASSDGSPASTFANNENWHDDTCDGPVTAEVIWEGKALTVTPAWVVSAPPNYGPMRKSVRTMWDVMRDTGIAANKVIAPVRPSFNTDIRPIFERMSGLQWVNAGFAAAFGWRGPFNLATPAMLARLSRSNPAERELRKTIANNFRVVERDGPAPQLWPWVYGDAFSSTSPRAYASLTKTQLGFLQQWAAGDFEEDYDPLQLPVRYLSDLPVNQQPAMLTRAAMEFCVADAFHPGCEMGWPMRNPGLYSAAFRINPADTKVKEPQYGPILNPGALPGGVLGAQYPGGLTRWMAVPWQTDTASCLSGYQKVYDPYLPTFWPARVPNQVLTADSYQVVMDKARPMGERMAAFASRASWTRPLNAQGSAINNMISLYGDMGVVEQRPGPGDPDFPPVMEVESIPTPKHAELTARFYAEPSAKKKKQEDEFAEKMARFPFGLR